MNYSRLKSREDARAGSAGADTIFALATGAARAGVAVVRLSGPGAGTALAALTGRVGMEPRRLDRVRVCDPSNGEIIDEGLAVLFPAPRSFTGEDVGELHLHGGPAVIEGVLSALVSMAGLRAAEPGEFTRRAFENGKMDLTAAEGLADLVAAETTAQRRQALRQMEGALGELYENWRTRLIGALAHFEAEIDFSDEDLPAGLQERVAADVAALAGELRAHLDDGHRGVAIREGFQVAIVGPPNAGKSSLLNRLAGRDAAIVSTTAGTTRDVVSLRLELGGYAVTVSDTAGLRAAGDSIELEGVRRARATAGEADLKLAVFDGGDWPDLDAATRELVDGTTVAVLNKCDLAGVPMAPVHGELTLYAVSAKTGAGMERLVSVIVEQLVARMGDTGAPALTRIRHRTALEACHTGLERFAGRWEEPELAAEDLRLAARELGRITGRVEVDDVLDVIFKDFCIGK